FTENGWFRTGDLGYFDDNGELHLLGRLSTLIKTESGEKIQTEDVEAAYAEQSAIREIGVLGEKGKLVALIVPDRASSDDGKEAIRKAVETASRRLPSHQRISDYAITRDALPRTRLGKIQRHRLAERYKEAKEGGEKAASKQADIVAHPPAQKYAPSPGVYPEWVAGCKGGTPAGSTFDGHGGGLTSMVLLGCLAVRLGRVLEINPE